MSVREVELTALPKNFDADLKLVEDYCSLRFEDVED